MCIHAVEFGLLKASSYHFQDFDVRLWHVVSRQCVRTLIHKDIVGTVKFFLPSAGIFDIDAFKPSVVLAPFEKNVQSSNPDENYVLQVKTKLNTRQSIIRFWKTQRSSLANFGSYI